MAALKTSKIFWAEKFKMGFPGSREGEDVTGRNTHKRYVAIPSARCSGWHVIVFEY